MSGNPGQDAYTLAFQISPIMLTNGIASFMPFVGLPLIALTEAINFNSLLGAPQGLDLQNTFATFVPMGGATLVDNAISMYSFANQTIAANAIISQPLVVSMRMICPARGAAGYARKIATMAALKASLDVHNQTGGTYTVLTPSYTYTNCIMTGMIDISAHGNQSQIEWRMDFKQPLTTLEQAAQALNSQISKIEAGVSSTGASSGLSTIVGQFSIPGLGALVPSGASPAGQVAGSIPGIPT
jgi:hypothetical protein